MSHRGRLPPHYFFSFLQNRSNLRRDAFPWKRYLHHGHLRSGSGAPCNSSTGQSPCLVKLHGTQGETSLQYLFYPKVCNPWAPMEHIPLAFLFPTQICNYHVAVSRYLLEVNRSQNLLTLQSKARDRWGGNSQGKTSNLCRSEIGVDKPPSPLARREG